MKNKIKEKFKCEYIEEMKQINTEDGPIYQAVISKLRKFRKPVEILLGEFKTSAEAKAAFKAYEIAKQ